MADITRKKMMDSRIVALTFNKISFLSLRMLMCKCNKEETCAAKISEMSPHASMNAGRNNRSEGNTESS